eukprot:s1542_g8.t1
MERTKEPWLDPTACGERRLSSLDLDAWRQDLQRLHVTIDEVVQTFISSQTCQLDAVATQLASQRDKIIMKEKNFSELSDSIASFVEAEARRLQGLGFDVLSPEDASREGAGILFFPALRQCAQRDVQKFWDRALPKSGGAFIMNHAPLLGISVLAEGAAVAHQEWAEQALFSPYDGPGAAGRFTHELLESPSACRDCCNDGKAYVPCLDVEACAAAAPPTGRYALIFSYVGRFAPKLLQYLDSAKAAALSANKADLLLLMTVSDAASMTTALRADLEKEGIQLRSVDWALPPGMRFTKEENWCGQKDFIRLHALGLQGLDEYDAVAYFDNDIEFQGDITPLLRCASTGHFLSTNGGIGEALNVGFFALQPHKALLQAAVDFAKEADYSQLTGWANEGWRPSGGYYVGGECGQGFFHTLFYKRSSSLRAMMARVGRKSLASGRSVSVDAGGSLRQARDVQVGFYFPVHDQVEGVVEVIRSARQFYPESPIFVLQDGGSVDFGKLCKQERFRCIFERMPGENSRWNPHSWFARMRHAAELLNTRYIIYLEPDVKILRRHEGDFPHDAGGVYDNFNPAMSKETKAYLEHLGRQRNPHFNVTWEHFGLCGGSYYRTEAVLDAFRPEHVLMPGMDKTMSSDFAMAVALAARGWTVYPWEESAQKFSDVPSAPVELAKFKAQWPALNPRAAFQHNHKDRDGLPESRLPIPSEPPELKGALSFDSVRASLERPIHRAQPGSLLLHPDYLLNAGSEGLPKAEGPRPSWLLKEDLLVVDARREAHGGMLIVQPVFMEAGPLWGASSAPARPRWLRAILATNRHHARKHGLCLVIRWLPSKPQLQEYLLSPQNFSHVLLLDADATIIRHERNVLGEMAAMLDKEGRDVLFTDEDWLLHGARRINGGVILAKGSSWSQDLFRDTVEAHELGPRGLQRWREFGFEQCTDRLGIIRYATQVSPLFSMSLDDKQEIDQQQLQEASAEFAQFASYMKQPGQDLPPPGSNPTVTPLATPISSGVGSQGDGSEIPEQADLLGMDAATDRPKRATPTTAPGTAPATAAPEIQKQGKGRSQTPGRTQWQQGRDWQTYRQWPSKKESDRNKDDEIQRLKHLLQAMARLVLRLEDSLAITQLDSEFVIFFQTGVTKNPWSITDPLFRVASNWKQQKEADPVSLSQPLRSILFHAMVTALQGQLEQVEKDPAVRQRATELGLLEDETYPYLQWDAERRQHQKASMQPYSQADLRANVNLMLQLSIFPSTVARFHALRRHTETLTSEVLPFLLTIHLRSTEAQQLYLSGISFNRGGCTVRSCGEPVSDPSMVQLGMEDARLQILHFMGDHTLADKVLCDGHIDYTGEGANGCSALA